MAEFGYGTTYFENEFLKLLLEWFERNTQCSSSMSYLKQVIETSKLALMEDVENIDEEVKKKRKKKQETMPNLPIQPNEDGSEPKPQPVEFVEASTILDEKTDYIPALYTRENLYEFSWQALRMKLLYGFCPYIATIDPNTFTVRFEVYDGFIFSSGLNIHNPQQFIDKITIYPPDPSNGVYLADIVLSCGTSTGSDQVAYSHSNHSSDSFIAKNPNRLGKNRYLYMYIWERSVPATIAQVSNMRNTILPKTALVSIYNQLNQIGDLEASQYAALMSQSKSDFVLSTLPVPQLSSSETASLAMDKYGATPTDVREQNKSDVSAFAQRRQESQRLDSMKTQIDTFYNNTDPSRQRVVSSSTQDNRVHYVAGGLQLAASRFPSDSTEALKMSLDQRDVLYRQINQILIGTTNEYSRASKESDKVQNKFSNELSYLRYSATILSHQRSVISILNFSHKAVANIMVGPDMKLLPESTFGYEPQKEEMTKTKRIRRDLLRKKNLRSIFNAEFIWQEDKHTSRILEQGDLLEYGREGFMTVEEVRKALLK
jgi:hypothetical protein